MEELPNFEAAKQQFGDSVVILAVNRAEPISTQRKFLSSFPIKLTINFLTDSADSVARLYDVNVLPSTFFIDSDGVIVDKQLGQISWHELENKINGMLAESHQSTP